MPPYYQMGMAPGMPGGPPNVVPSYNPPQHPPQQAPMGGYQMMPPTYIQAPQPPQRYPGPESPRNPASPRHMQTGTMQQQQSPVSPIVQNPHSGGGLTSPRNLKSPQSASAKNSPLSLASITTPYNTVESQPKNYHAQTLMSPGERLRLALLAREDPADRINGAPQWRRQQPRARKSSWSEDLVIQLCQSRYSPDNPGGTPSLSWYPCSRPETSKRRESGWAITSEKDDVLQMLLAFAAIVGGGWACFTLSMVQFLVFGLL